MNSNPQTASQHRLKPTLIWTFVAFFLVTVIFGPYKTSANAPDEATSLAQADAAVTEAQAALSVALTKKLEAEQRLAELREFSILKEPDGTSLSNLRRLTDTVNGMFDEAAEPKTLQAQLKDAQKKLAEATKKLTAAKTVLDAETSTPKIDAAKTTVNRKIEAAAAVDPDLPALATKLDIALGLIYGRVTKLATAADKRLGPLKQNITEPNDLLNLLHEHLNEVPPTIQFDLGLQDSWAQLSAGLKNFFLTDHDTRVTAPDKAISDLHTSVGTVVNKLSAQLTLLGQHAVTRKGELSSSMDRFSENAQAQEKEALENISSAQEFAEESERIKRIVDSIAALAESASINGFEAGKTRAAQKLLIDNVTQLRGKTSEFQDLLSGDRTLWTTEKIRLYYFTDVPRLVRTLNPTASLMGGDVEARRRAEERLEKLRAAEDAQSEAGGMVAGLKRRVENMRQKVQAATARLELANLLAETATKRDADLNRRPAADIRPGQKELSAEDKNKRERERAAAQQEADRLNDEQSGLAADLARAESQLETAQAAFERASSATIRAAQAESAAFANARDNAAFWFAGASAISTDPAKRVEITSSTGGENAIFVRGRREDVAKVKDIVSKLDEPAPQARMTLWKIELNSDATSKGAERFNEALSIVETELAATREQIAEALSLFLEAINQQAEWAAKHSKDPDGARTDCHEKSLYSQYEFEADTRKTDVTGRFNSWRRYAMYSAQVRRELGVDFIAELGFDNPKQFGLKDPASATTLNEALIVLLLSKRSNRNAIMTKFESALETKLGKKFDRLHKSLNLVEDSKVKGSVNPEDLDDSKDTELTRQQAELVYAIRGLLLKHLVGRITGLQSRVETFTDLHYKKNGRDATEYRDEIKKVALTKSEEELYGCLQKKLPKILDPIHSEFLVSPVDVLEGKVQLVEPGDGTIGLQRFKDGRPFGSPKIYNLRPSPARVAAADGMLDVFTKAFEDDIDSQFIRPMLEQLRKKLKKSGIGFGVIQRTSVLATNRVVARVDPRATAELSVGQETNLIQGLQQLAQLTLDAKTGNLPGVLGRFNTFANEPNTAEIFGITSGSAFQVTPIFDPSGQALRFKFDFVDTTMVREPRGTINPRLPRVERHTVNTEVQLSNLEIREVSRFESDSKIGLPTTYRGGLPILKDIPGVRPIPLIGWFVRRKGSNAIAQRSLIFAQTTMSPTIGDILDLLETTLQQR